MNNRIQGRALNRQAAAPIHRGPQANTASAYPGGTFPMHAPNAALLIDFDNVTMGIRSDLGNELRNLLGSDIIKGKVAVQRAYADWRRYPQYIVPLTEASIDLIFAPAYGSSKKNATDIRLAIDAIELVFTRPEIGTIILLSGDSDFSSLVIKLKEYGKYIIGVGIRESSSDLLVMNCDEYYSYNALAGLVKTNEEEGVRKDPWELVNEALTRMKRNGDVMRSDRLKQVMQELDSNFDEKDLGHPKFSRFVQEAASRGLLKLTKLENGQLEVGLPDEADAAVAPAAGVAAPPARGPREERGRGRRGGRGRDREPRRETAAAPAVTPAEGEATPPVEAVEPQAATSEVPAAATVPAPSRAPVADAPIAEMQGERLTRDEAFDLVRRAMQAIAKGNSEISARANEVRATAHKLLGRDSESLAERLFQRILRDAHDANVVDLRKRGDDYEVSLAAAAPPIADQLRDAEVEAKAATADSQASRTAASAQSLRRGMGGRGGGRGRGPSRGGQAEMPPELMTLGVIDEPGPVAETAPAPAAAPAAAASKATASDEARTEPAADKRDAGKPAAKKRSRRRGGAKKTTAGAAPTEADTQKAPAAKRGKRVAKRVVATREETSGEGEGTAARKPARKRGGRGRKTASTAAE